MNNKMDIKTMITRAKEGDAEALGQMYNAFAPKMRMVCSKILKKDTSIIDDLVHDSFILAYSSLDQLKNPNKLEAWLCIICRHVTIRYIQSEQAKSMQQLCSIKEESPYLLDISKAADTQVLAQDIMDAINELPHGYRNILRLHIFEGYSHQEIGEMLGIAPHSSSSQLSRAKSALLQIMKERKMFYVILSSLVMVPIYKLFVEKRQIVDRKEMKAPNIVKQTIGSKPQIAKNKQVGNKKNRSYTSTNIQKDKCLIAPQIAVQDTTISDITFEATNLSEAALAMSKTMESYQDSIILDKNDSVGVIASIHDYAMAEHISKKAKRGSWHIGGIGLLGFSMKQDGSGTLLSTDSNIDSSIPVKISNWEAYHENLLLNNPMPDEKTKTLMNIAANNSGDIEEHEDHHGPITFGLAISRQLTQRWSIETGIQYTLLHSTFSIGRSGYSIDQNQKLHYIGIPLRVSYHLWGYKNMSIITSGGITTNIPVYGDVKETYIEDYKQIPSDRWSISAPWQISIGTSIGFQYKFASRLSLYVEPTLYYQVPNGSSVHSIWTEHPFMYSMPFGIRLTW